MALAPIAAAVEADLMALVRLQGDACLWLDCNLTVRRELGNWPRAEQGPALRVGRSFAELAPAAVVERLRAQRAGSSERVDIRWSANIGGANREYQLRASPLSGQRWLVVAREVAMPADPMLASECQRLRARVMDLELRLQTALDGQAMFAARLKEEVERAARRADPVSVVRLEMHDLAAYGEQYGPEATVAVLGTVDQALRRDARAGDFLARWDRFGFAMLLPNTDRQAARLVAERHQRGVGGISWPHADIDVRVGLATLWRDANSPEELLRKSQPVH